MFIKCFIILSAATAGTLAVPQPQRFGWGAKPTTTPPAAPPPASTPPAGAPPSTSVPQPPPASAAPPASSPPPASPPPATSAAAAPPGGGGGAAAGGESHQITILNNCGEGRPLIAYAANRAGQPVQGSITINGPVDSGIAWMDGTKHNCGFDGTGCGFTEFSLLNSGQNSADYSLLTTGLGDHYFKYAMDFRFTGQCTKAPGKCVSGEDCPGAYTGTDTFSGTPPTCPGQNVGIHITFC
ncbi:hypothetical protein I302_102506 [Kwoniella bestiolae CBS 10118]|uniref:Uncharacterized protein n=1 Tax=Kwoniella bestiolae CBS 10118 TaxID=1296100 RepID=A0A1B9GFD9_9TREE|nr:hypothetical protein I302_01197 [Kwoniella bestiolae CBS 10118]OCF29685.1 hypothetical protein I302_01197 [Kwoniella bestiolae CBS 10118]